MCLGCSLPSVGNEPRDNSVTGAAFFIGNIIANALGVGNNGDNTISSINETVAKQCKIDGSFLNEIVPAITDELKRAKEFFDVIEK